MDELSQVDVVIVGAGAAGLAAACALREAGRSVAILEGRGRVGGRIFTYRDGRSPIPIELGAEFLHGDTPETDAVTRDAGLGTYEVVGHMWDADQGDLSESDDHDKRVGRVLRKLDPNRTPDRSFLEFLHEQSAKPKRARDRRMARDFVENFHAADPARLSERSLARLMLTEGTGVDKAGRVTEGYDRVTAWLAREVYDAITLNTVVEEIAWSKGRVQVHTRSADGERTGVVTGRSVVITVPISLLHPYAAGTGAIALTPDVPAVREAATLLAMGHALHVHFAFTEPFWTTELNDRPLPTDPSQLGFLFGRGADVPVWWTMFPMRAPHLVGWVGGPNAEALAQLDDQAIAGRALASLAHHLMFPEDRLAALLDGYWVHNWSRDPLSRGAYSYVTVGGEEAAATLAQPIDDTLFFAGEATDTTGHIGTVEGALATGRRAARAVLGALGAADDTP